MAYGAVGYVQVVSFLGDDGINVMMEKMVDCVRFFTVIVICFQSCGFWVRSLITVFVSRNVQIS